MSLLPTRDFLSKQGLGIAGTILCITFHLLEASMKKQTMVNGSFVKVRTQFLSPGANIYLVQTTSSVALV